ncbi:MAG: hypothetical protein EOO77_28055 [Oxalobacteraceae bacterium]|nr:MAG: hypothetical protein EOO77_28055 [Oxalobacteraceae bacterium]
MENIALQFGLLGQLRLLIVQRNEDAKGFDIFDQVGMLAPAVYLPNGQIHAEDAPDVASKEVEPFKAETEGGVGDRAAKTLREEMRRRNLDK